MKNLGQFLQSIGGRATGKATEYVFSCPVCDGKDKLYFNSAKAIGFCQKCSKSISLVRLAKLAAGIPASEVQTYIQDAQLELARRTDFREGIVDKLFGNLTPDFNKLPEVAFPEGFLPLSDVRHSHAAKKAKQYLEGRGFSLRVLEALGFGICLDGYYANRVIIPFYEDGRCVYWQGRDFSGHVDIADKIWNPPSWLTGTGKSQVLFNYDGARNCKSVYIAESWGSALAIGSCAVGLNGKILSVAQKEKLLNTQAERFILVLDPGTAQETMKMASALAPHREVYVVFLKDGDPNEISRSALLEAIRGAQFFDTSSNYVFLGLDLSR